MMDLQKIINEVRVNVFKHATVDANAKALKAVGRINHNIFMGVENPITIDLMAHLVRLEGISSRAWLFVPAHAVPKLSDKNGTPNTMTVYGRLPQNPYRDTAFEMEVAPTLQDDDEKVLRVVYAVDTGDDMQVLWDSEVSETERKDYLSDNPVSLKYDGKRRLEFNNDYYHISEELIVIKISIELLMAGYYSRYLRGCGVFSLPLLRNADTDLSEATHMGLTKIFGGDVLLSHGITKKVEAKKPTGRKSKTTKK